MLFTSFALQVYGRNLYKITALLQFVYYIYILVNDLRYNKTGVFRHNITYSMIQWYRKRERYKPFQKKLVDRFGYCLA